MSLQGPGSQNDPGSFADLAAKIRSLNERIEALERGSMLRPAGISVSPEGMTIDSSLTVNGDLTTTGDTVITGDLTTSGNTVIGGNASITGTLSLPAGIIDNDALANPIAQDSQWGRATGMAIPNAWTELASCSITIPAGFTRLQFSAIGMVQARNDTGSTQYLLGEVRRQINGSGTPFGSIMAQSTLPNGFWGTSTAPYIYGETVIPGDVHRFWIQSWAGGAGFSAHVDHVASVEVLAMFSR